MAAPAFLASDPHAERLADPALREALLKFARRRLPAAEVDDLVQNTLADALASPAPPSDAAEFRRWVQGIARHKVADLYRRRGRQPALSGDLPEAVADPGPATGELAQWIEQELPRTAGARATLTWLLRESDGETLDEIAREAALPAPRVRQRVSRLRRHFQTRWLALGAAGLALLLGLGVTLHFLAQDTKDAPIAHETVPALDRANALRKSALEKCGAADYRACLADLDAAKALDPNGETAAAVRDARAAAQAALTSTPNQLVPQQELTPKYQPTEKQLVPKLAPKQLSPKVAPKPVPKQLSPKVAPKLAPAPKLKKEFAVPQEQQQLPIQQAPLFNDLPSKSNGDRKNLKPTKD
jgi:DNA-directed RNA polymerase specialized sigma24 family protein